MPSGDVHPLPGPDSIPKKSISVRITGRYNRPVTRRRNTFNCISIKTITTNVWHSNSIRDTTNMMRLCLLNVRSINNKAMTVKDLVVNHAVDILAMAETWLGAGNHDDIVMGTLCPNGYRFLRVPRPQGRGGGVGLLFKDSLEINSSVCDTFKTFELMDVRLRSLECI